MAHYSGKAGSVLAPGAIAGIKSWSLEYTVSMLDTTDFADAGVSSFIPGITEWHGSFEGYKEGTPIALTTGAVVALQFLETQTANEVWFGNGYITAIRPSVDHDGIVSYSYDFQGTGALTVALA